jgi:hypothetical protein
MTAAVRVQGRPLDVGGRGDELELLYPPEGPDLLDQGPEGLGGALGHDDLQAVDLVDVGMENGPDLLEPVLKAL